MTESETTTLAALERIRGELCDISAKLSGQATITKRLHDLVWAGIAVFTFIVIIAAVGGFVIWHEGQVRIDQIQDSRLLSCRDINRAVTALTDRDQDLVDIAVEFADEAPEVGDQIVERLNALPSAAALEPQDCEKVVQRD